ncbi:MAG: isochorismatase family protein [Polyangiaceae bacterium]
MSLGVFEPYSIPDCSSWSPQRVGFRLDTDRSFLLVHDLQRYFLAPYQEEREPLPSLLRNVHRIVEVARAARVPIAFTMQSPQQSRQERGLLWDVWGPGITAKPELSDLAQGLRPAPTEDVFEKRRYSAFRNTELEVSMRKHARNQLVIVGIYAHIGCYATALDGFMSDIQSFMVGDAVADFSLEAHSTALRLVSDTCGVVLSTERVLSTFAETCVRRALAGLIESDPTLIPVDDALADCGLDSIRFMTLIERIFAGRRSPDFDDLLGARSIAELAKLLIEVEPCVA